jgi:oxygen-independent coproporphyrinogen-3 oxidase
MVIAQQRPGGVGSPSTGGIGLPDTERIRELVAKYDRPGPRYTSYPTAPSWSDSFGETALRAALRRRGADRLAIYVHIPFCESLCTYCACNREIVRRRDVVEPYLDNLAREAEAVADACGTGTWSSTGTRTGTGTASASGGGRECAQLALGGGTPTYLDPHQLARLCEIVDRHFPPADGAERSVEVDPRVTSRAQLEVLARYGFNRISLGVQDLSPVVQRAIHRVQSLEQTASITQAARELGYESVNYDLIYGLPFQTVESFAETLDQVLGQQPDRIALYSYAHVTWVSKQQRGFERGDLPDAQLKLEIFLAAMSRLTQAGYLYLGLDHFVRPGDSLDIAASTGDLRRNFMGYTTGAPLDVVALGPSGISELRDVYAQSARSSADWGQCIAEGRLATQRGWALSGDDIMRRWLIQRLMCHGDIDRDDYRAAFGEQLQDRIPDLAERLSPFESDGLLTSFESGWRLTPEGRVLMRPIAMVFDAYLDPKSATAPRSQRFSRTV